MKGRIFTFICTILLSTIVFNKTLAQQSSILTGIVTDATTDEPLPGATVYIKEYNLGTITNLNGEFSIPKVPVGEQIVTVSYLGYLKVEQQKVIEAGQKNQLNVKLVQDITTLNEVVVFVQANGQNAAINQQWSSDQMKNVVSAMKIKEVPDANAAESIARLPGISLQRSGGEGININIRGLSPEFNKITINGMEVPSTGENTRTSDLSMISSENLGGIEVYKSLTPDMDGDAIGGTVDMKIAKAQNKPERFIRTYGYYNMQENDPNQYKISGRWSQRVFNNKLGIQASGNYEKRNRSSDGLNATYELGPRDAIDTTYRILLLQDASVKDIEEYRFRYGGNITLDYSIKGWDFMLLTAYNNTTRHQYYRAFEYDKSAQKTYSTIKNPEIQSRLLSNMFTAEHDAGFAKFDITFSLNQTKSNTLHENELKFRQDIPEGNLIGLDYETIQPTFLLNNVNPDEDGAMYSAEHSEYEVLQTSYMASLNVSIPYRFGNNISGNIKLGGKYKQNSRNNDRVSSVWPQLYNDASVSFPISDYYDNEYDPGNFLDGQANIGLILDPTLTNEFYSQWSDTSNNKFYPDYFDSHNQKNFDQIYAGYIMAKLNVGKIVTFIPGVRYEEFHGDYEGETRIKIGDKSGIKTDTTSIINHKDFLPMVNLIIRPSEWLNIRLAVTKTLVRPGYRQLIPWMDYNNNEASNVVQMGNPSLEPTRSWNYDAYLSFKHNKLGFFSVGGFYKKLDGVITDITRYLGTNTEIDSLGLPRVIGVYNGNELTLLQRNINRPENTKDSYVTGIELEWQTNFRYLPKPFDGLVLSLNYTRLWSQTTYGYSQQFFRGVNDPWTGETREEYWVLFYQQDNVRGQSEHIANVSLGYDYKKFSARATYTYQGESLSFVGNSSSQLNGYNDSWSRIDFTFKQGVGEYLTIFLNASNITNQFDRKYQGDNNWRPREELHYGESIELGLQLKF
jgi:TonB-dependent receptor